MTTKKNATRIMKADITGTSVFPRDCRKSNPMPGHWKTGLRNDREGEQKPELDAGHSDNRNHRVAQGMAKKHDTVSQTSRAGEFDVVECAGLLSSRRGPDVRAGPIGR